MSNYTRTLVYLSEGVHPTNTVDCTQTGTTLLTRTRPATSSGAQFNPLQVFIKVFGVTSVTAPATISIGTNSPNFNNIVDGQSIDGPARMLQVTSAMATPLNQLPVDTDIMINVTTAATATSLNIRAGVIGVEV